MRETVDANGSYIAKGPRFSVLGARGNLWHRQVLANQSGCVCYVEQHLNASLDKRICYAMALLPHNASAVTQAWAKRYTALVAETFRIPDRGIVMGPERGGYNIRFTRMPTMLVEPGFISHEPFADQARTGEGLDALARCLVTSVSEYFPGGLVGLSVGHAYRGKPDPGAPVAQTDILDPAFDSETELNDAIINAAEEMLLAVPGDP